MASIMVPTFAFTRTHRATTFQMTKEKKNLCKPRQKAGFEVLTAVVLLLTLILFLTAYKQALQSLVFTSVTCMMDMSKLEVNLRRLLSQCENMAKEDPQKDWRLDKYIGALDEMVTDLQKLPNKPSKDTMAEYIRRVMFLKGIIETHKLTNPAEKVVAVQLVPHGPATSSEAVIKEIHQTTVSKYAKELREQLLQNGTGSDDSLRQRKQKSTGEDLDVLLKYHHSMQEKIADDMLILARNLKEQSQLAGSIIKKDTETVEKSSHKADHNFARLKVESERLEEHSRRACKCWMWVMVAAVVIIFINMVLFMKVMKKKS